jgi:hypothetical protein
MKFRLSFVCLAVFLAGCNKKALKIETTTSKLKKTDYEQLLAQHSEIPDAAVGFQVESIIVDQSDNQSIEIIYKPLKKNHRTVTQIKESYIADMEMLGWQCIGEFQGDGIQLIFQKAGRKLLSTIAIQSDLQIKIIVYKKK